MYDRPGIGNPPMFCRTCGGLVYREWCERHAQPLRRTTMLDDKRIRLSVLRYNSQQNEDKET